MGDPISAVSFFLSHYQTFFYRGQICGSNTTCIFYSISITIHYDGKIVQISIIRYYTTFHKSLFLNKKIIYISTMKMIPLKIDSCDKPIKSVIRTYSWLTFRLS